MIVMLINYTKTKEMILGNAKSNPPPTLLIDGKKIERVSSFKLLGVHISDDFRWENHINAVCSKVSSKLYFLKQLKRAGVSSDDLLYFYTVVIQPVFEYACVVLHHNLTALQSDKLGSLQKRALRIIHGDFAVGKSYELLVSFSKIEPLFERRTTIGKTFFNKMCYETNCLNYLLPDKCDPRF